MLRALTSQTRSSLIHLSSALRIWLVVSLHDNPLKCTSPISTLVHVAFTNDLISYTKCVATCRHDDVFWHFRIREYLTDTATNNILTLLQRNDGLTPAEAEAKIRREIKKAEDSYVAAAREILDDPVLGKNERIRKLVLNIPYGMGGNVSVFCSPTPSTQIYCFQS